MVSHHMATNQGADKRSSQGWPDRQRPAPSDLLLARPSLLKAPSPSKQCRKPRAKYLKHAFGVGGHFGGLGGEDGALICIGNFF